MTLSRRRFLGQAPLGLLPFLPSCGGSESDKCCDVAGLGSRAVFRHGLASGDPLADAVIIWTRATPPAGAEGAPIAVDWRVASDPEMQQIVVAGQAEANAERDYTVKLDVLGLEPGQVYYYDFGALGERTRIGRTKTLPRAGVSHARLAVAACANYPAGYFNAYRLIAARSDLDLVLHLGDYLYEYENGAYGDGTGLGRVPVPDRELVSLDDYRARHAQYKTDADLQELHRQHPLVAIWDDHEISNDGYRDGAGNHQADTEGSWGERKRGAQQAYLEWMPVREAGPAGDARIYRAFAYGDLFDLVMLDTRYAGRDAAVARSCDRPAIESEARTLLGAEQEAWFFDTLRSSRVRGARWRFVGQQVMLAQLSDPRLGCVTELDQWDGYAASRARLFELLRAESIDNVVVLTGDAHSSWAFDLAEDPFEPEAYDPATGEGSLAVELVAPSVTSPYDFVSNPSPETHPHLKFMDVLQHGYLLLDVTAERVQAEWYFARSIIRQSVEEALGAVFQARDGENRLVAVSEPSEAAAAAPPAP